MDTTSTRLIYRGATRVVLAMALLGLLFVALAPKIGLVVFGIIFVTALVAAILVAVEMLHQRSRG